MFAYAMVAFGAGRVWSVKTAPGAATVNAEYGQMNLHNETVINVAALLQEPVGAARAYPLRLDTFALDDDMWAKDVDGEVRLVRLADEILSDVTARGTVKLECDRCLREYDQLFQIRFCAEYRPTVDVQTGIDLDVAKEDERFTIDERHELDIAEALRQEILVALPMRTVCGEDCPGPAMPLGDDQGTVDERLATLAQLLNDEPNDDTTQTR